MRSHFSSPPPASSAALSRHATRVAGFPRVAELVPFDFVVVDFSRRSTRIYAHDEAHAKRLAAQRLGVDPARITLRPAPYCGVEAG